MNSKRYNNKKNTRQEYTKNNLSNMMTWQGVIERLAWGGLGISHNKDGKIIMLLHELALFPGEIVSAKIEYKNNYYMGYVIDILKKDSKRIEPTCKIANTCGGCNLWGANKSIGHLKREMVTDLFSRQLSHIPKWQWLEAPEDTKRHRIQLHWNGHDLGFFRRQSHSIVTVETCSITVDPINNAIDKLRYALKYNKLPNHINRWELSTGTPASEIYASTNDSSWILEDDCWYKDNRPIQHIFDNITIYHSAGTFFQVCPQWAWIAFNRVINSWSLPNGTLFDLYSGVGFFSIILRKRFTRYILVENNKSSIIQANNNLNSIQLSLNTKCIVDDVAKWFPKGLGTKDDLILLDPPRQGLTEDLCYKIKTANVNTIILVGCDGAIFCRDIKRLAPIWELAELFVIDLFPMTHQVECVALLKKA